MGQAETRRSRMIGKLPLVDYIRCTRCGLCAQACPCQAIVIEAKGPVFHCPEVCSGSTLCVALIHRFHPCEEVCPEGAIACTFAIVSRDRTDIAEGA